MAQAGSVRSQPGLHSNRDPLQRPRIPLTPLPAPRTPMQARRRSGRLSTAASSVASASTSGGKCGTAATRARRPLSCTSSREAAPSAAPTTPAAWRGAAQRSCAAPRRASLSWTWETMRRSSRRPGGARCPCCASCRQRARPACARPRPTRMGAPRSSTVQWLRGTCCWWQGAVAIITCPQHCPKTKKNLLRGGAPRKPGRLALPLAN